MGSTDQEQMTLLLFDYSCPRCGRYVEPDAWFLVHKNDFNCRYACKDCALKIGYERMESVKEEGTNSYQS